mmetsp:Transcript_2180/g.3032  ORF Transcript_2180/g.3032 Transcript_2180/m.3032 type:complete len:93 (+) Transcript_2180:205-483(+)
MSYQRVTDKANVGNVVFVKQITSLLTGTCFKVVPTLQMEAVLVQKTIPSGVGMHETILVVFYPFSLVYRGPQRIKGITHQIAVVPFCSGIHL